MIRFDHVGIIVNDLEAAAAFFELLGLTRLGSATIEGDWMDRVIGIENGKSEILMLRAPGSETTLELSRFIRPVSDQVPQAAPSNQLGLRSLAFQVDDVEDIVRRVRASGYGLVGEVAQYENIYRLCYVRGPEGMIIMLAERIDGK